LQTKIKDLREQIENLDKSLEGDKEADLLCEIG